MLKDESNKIRFWQWQIKVWVCVYRRFLKNILYTIWKPSNFSSSHTHLDFHCQIQIKNRVVDWWILGMGKLFYLLVVSFGQVTSPLYISFFICKTQLTKTPNQCIVKIKWIDAYSDLSTLPGQSKCYASLLSLLSLL